MRQLPEAVRERGDARELLREAAENVPAPPHGTALRNAQVCRIDTFLNVLQISVVDPDWIRIQWVPGSRRAKMTLKNRKMFFWDVLF